MADTTRALRRLRGRIEHLCEIVAASPGSRLAEEAPDIIAQECAYLVEEGAEAYHRYVDKLDDAAVREALDRELSKSD